MYILKQFVQIYFFRINIIGDVLQEVLPGKLGELLPITPADQFATAGPVKAATPTLKLAVNERDCNWL